MLLRDYALRLLALRREASSALDELKSLERGHLQLAANEYTCMYLLPAIDAFRREFPACRRHRAAHAGLAHSRGAEPAQLRAGRHLLPARSCAVPHHCRLWRQPGLYRQPAHPLAGAERVSIRDLGKEIFIAHNVASPLRRKVIEAFQRYRTPLNMDIELPTIEAIKRFVAMGNGVALVPHLTVARELETGDLVRVPVDELDMRRVLRLVTAGRPRSPTRPRPSCVRWQAGPGAGTAVFLPGGTAGEPETGGTSERCNAAAVWLRETRALVEKSPSGARPAMLETAFKPRPGAIRAFTILRAGSWRLPGRPNMTS